MIEPKAESTQLSTAKGKYSKWVAHRASRDADPAMTWIFTDGSTTGRHAAVIVHKGGGVIQRLTGRAPRTSTRNVGAELNGMLLGLRHAPRGERVVVVSDYLGIAAWMTGNWKINDPEVRSKVEKAKAIIEDRGLTASFVHHAGHQSDASDFTRYNCEADALCSGRGLRSSAEETGHGEEPSAAPLKPRSRRRCARAASPRKRP